MIKYDLHTHTAYCDGNDAPEKMIKRAIELGFSVLGFSGHSHTPIDESYCMSQKDVSLYFNEITELKKKYVDKIKLLCGIEMDYYSDTDTQQFDYVISSVHYIVKDGVAIPTDESGEVLMAAARKLYGGDIYSLIEDYYMLVSHIPEKIGGNIVGHFDVISKFNEDGALFDEKDTRYVASWKRAADSLIKNDFIFEINTGAIIRGYRTQPYPGEDILKYLHENGAEVIYSGDIHDYLKLGSGMEIAEAVAKSAGYKGLFDRLPDITMNQRG